MAVATSGPTSRRVGLLPAAGRAQRLGISSPKELLSCHGRPVIDHSVAHLLGAGVDEIVVVTRAGKEAVVDHLHAAWPAVRWTFVSQPEPIGHLIDALRCAVEAVAGAVVHLLFPDTCVAPNPFAGAGALLADGVELALLCHDAADGEGWRHFGVVDPVNRTVVEKPALALGSTLCWGAAAWAPAFTNRLVEAQTLTDAINAAEWGHAVTIASYADIGLGPTIDLRDAPQSDDRGPAPSVTDRAEASGPVLSG